MECTRCPKKSEIVTYLYKNSVNIACIQETQLGPNSNYNIKGYLIERLDAKAGKWGVAVFLKAGINYQRLAVSDGVNAVHVKVDRPAASPINVISIYVPPPSPCLFHI